GQDEPRRRLLESHLRMLERLSERAGADPAIGLLAALVQLDLAPDAGARARLRGAIRRFPANGRLPHLLEEKLALWIANDVNPYMPGPNLADESECRLDPVAHARLIIRALEARCEEFGANHSLLPAAAIQVASAAYSRGKEQRTAKRLDDARWTAACLSAFAQ